jgi:beta-lactamase regulating signal transducer with metallopeptidase domain
MPLLTHSALLKALGWSLFNSLWQMGLLWLFYRLFIVVFKSSSSNSRHNLAVILLGTGAIVSGAEWVAGYNFAVNDASAGLTPWPGGWLLAQGDPVSLWQTARHFINEALPWCSSLYLLVLGILLARYSNHYFHSRRLTHTGLSKLQPELRVFAEATSRRMGIRQPVHAWLSSLVDTPLTLGFFKPVILLPVAMANSLTLQQTEAILLHELAHIRCNDYLLNLGVTALELLFFFNPFARLLINEVKREREHRCDDWVMQFRYDPHTYVSALLSLATHFPQRPRLTLAATGEGDNRLLLQRARRILQQKNSCDRKTARPALFLLFALLLMLGAERLQKPMLQKPLSPVRTTAGTTAIPDHNNRLPVTATRLGEMATIQFININPTAINPATPAPGSRPAVVHVFVHKAPGTVPANGNDNDHNPDTDPFSEEGDDNTTVLAAGGDGTVPPVQTYATTAIQMDKREYSFGNNSAATLVPAPEARKIKNKGNLPFVPHSSFSFQYMEDSVRPAEQLAYLQLFNRLEIATAIKKLEQDLALQLWLLEQKQAATTPSSRSTPHQLIRQQLILQQQFKEKLDVLQKKLERADSRLKIVYI